MDQINHKYIAVSYRLYIDQEDSRVIVEEMKEDQPFAFITGFGITLDDFEKKLENMEKSEEFDFILSKEQAYGNYEQEHVVDLDKAIFSINNHFDHEHIFKGATVPLQNEDGNRFLGRVLEITDDKVKMDLNHPLAGKDLNFVGKVLEAHDATDEEIKAFIHRMEHHCNCDDCEGGCDCGHDHDHGHCDHNHDHGHCGCGCHH